MTTSARLNDALHYLLDAFAAGVSPTGRQLHQCVDDVVTLIERLADERAALMVDALRETPTDRSATPGRDSRRADLRAMLVADSPRPDLRASETAAYLLLQCGHWWPLRGGDPRIDATQVMCDDERVDVMAVFTQYGRALWRRERER